MVNPAASPSLRTSPQRLATQVAISGRVLFSIAALYVLTFSILVSVQWQAHGFPLDDSYIHQTVARNFAEHGTLGFVIGKRSSGATSLLWTLIQALRYKILPFISPVAYNILFSYLLFAAIGPLLYLIGRRDGLPERLCFLLAVAPALSGNFLWLGLIGMEHVLFVFFSLLAIYLWLTRETLTPGSAALAGLAVGLLVISRPEAVIFGPLLLLAGFALHRTRTVRDIATLISFWLLFVAVSLTANWWTSGALLPATLKGRTWLYFHATGGPHSIRSMTRFCGAWVQRLPRHFSTHFTHQMTSVGEISSGESLFGIFLLAIALVGVVALLRKRPAAWSFLLLWAAIHFATYLLSFPAGGHGGRYQPLCLLLFFPLLFLGFETIFRAIFGHSESAAMALTYAVVLLAAVTSITTWRRVTFVGISHINDTHGRITAWMKQHVPLDASFAAFDIGRVSYDWPGQVIDLGGLVDPSYFPYLRDGKVPLYLAQQHIEYVLLPSEGTQDFGFTPAMTAHPIVEFCSAYDPWVLGFRYTIHATQCQRLYKLPLE